MTYRIEYANPDDPMGMPITENRDSLRHLEHHLWVLFWIRGVSHIEIFKED